MRDLRSDSKRRRAFHTRALVEGHVVEQRFHTPTARVRHAGRWANSEVPTLQFTDEVQSYSVHGNDGKKGKEREKRIKYTIITYSYAGGENVYILIRKF
jgi:hypothetical protein